MTGVGCLLFVIDLEEVKWVKRLWASLAPTLGNMRHRHRKLKAGMGD